MPETRVLANASERFRKRDFILLPLISLLTTLVMFGLAEAGSRMLWPVREDAACDVVDAFGALRAKPNCTVRNKLAEGPWVTYHFNECGYRTDASCGPKPPGTLRIALLGSSVSEGLGVPYEQTFAEQTAAALQRATGRAVQVENLGLQNLSPLHCYRRLNEVVALRPDLIVYAVSPFDIDQRMDPVQLAHRNDAEISAARPAAHYTVPFLKRLQKTVNESRAVLAAQHLLFSNSETYLRLYLAYGDRADYLRTPLSGSWQAKFSDFGLVLGDMAAHLRGAGIPLVLMAVPARPQAALLSVARQPARTDAFAFGRAVGEQAAKAEVPFVDALDGFRRIPHCDRLFYIVDAHLTGEGNAVLARALMPRLLVLRSLTHGGPIKQTSTTMRVPHRPAHCAKAIAPHLR